MKARARGGRPGRHHDATSTSRPGGRQIEALAFEVVSTQRLAKAGEKAAKLAAAGVRRVFAIDVARHRAFEWSAETGAWSICAAAGAIVDPALAAPLPVEALVHAAKADDAIAHALLHKGNAVLVDAIADAKAEGRVETILAVLAARGIAVSDVQRLRALATTDPGVLDAWTEAVATCPDASELFDRDP